MQKTNVRMVVQETDECAADFAQSLEKICHDLSIKYKDKISGVPFIVTSASNDGRQTATIQFVTTESDKTGEATFNGLNLHKAYDKFIKTKLLQTPQTDALYDFLLKEVIDDYVEIQDYKL